jgi:hypothetical protein
MHVCRFVSLFFPFLYFRIIIIICPFYHADNSRIVIFCEKPSWSPNPAAKVVHAWYKKFSRDVHEKALQPKCWHNASSMQLASLAPVRSGEWAGPGRAKQNDCSDFSISTCPNWSKNLCCDTNANENLSSKSAARSPKFNFLLKSVPEESAFECLNFQAKVLPSTCRANIEVDPRPDLLQHLGNAIGNCWTNTWTFWFDSRAAGTSLSPCSLFEDKLVNPTGVGGAFWTRVRCGCFAGNQYGSSCWKLFRQYVDLCHGVLAATSANPHQSTLQVRRNWLRKEQGGGKHHHGQTNTAAFTG